jgi:iron complex outermembrane receptor protein
MSASRRAVLRLASCSFIALTAASQSGGAWAATAITAAGAPVDTAPEVQEVIVSASKGRAADAAPVSSTLRATEPVAIITRKFIEESAPRVGDYTTTAILAPSMATTPNSNGPGATDGAKITMRGFQDGEFNVTYDGIAWGDTNGPSHHSNSFFPSSVIGGVVINRGPGNASDLGQANFGGSVNLFSLPFQNERGVRQTLTAASFGTYQGVTTLESGPIARLHGLTVVANFMEYQTDGYLTNSDSNGQNQFIKATLPLTSKINITALFTRNTDEYYQGDNSANATVAQTEKYGRRFALSNDPTLSTYKGYNHTTKQTDFEYLKGDIDLDHGFKAENTVYSYFYSNQTLSANNNAADQTLDPTYVGAGFGPNLAAANKVILTPAAAYPIGGSGYAAGLKVNGIPGYTKRNEYRVIGDIAKFTKDFDFGKLTVGAEYEHAFTQRQRFDFDLVTGAPDYREKAALFPGPSGCPGLPVQVAPGKTYNGACQEPLNIAYSEFSGWEQYQPFAEFEWKATNALTITPGVKYVNFHLFVHAPQLAVSGSIQPSYVSQTFTKILPFLTANYRIRPTWTAYAQYAQGFLVPNIGSFYVNAPQNNKVVPQESTNYQLGTVFSAGNLTFDGDVYYIVFKHKIQSVTILDPSSSLNGETYQTNSGGAVYKGVEGQVTYALPYGFAAFGNYTLNDAKAQDDPLNPAGNGQQIAKAPRWTGAFGLRSQRTGVLHAEDRWITTLNTKWIGQQTQTAASGAAGPTGLIHSFNQTDLSSTYQFSHYSLEVQVLNLFDRDDITSFKGKALIAGTNLPALTSAQGGAANVFTYQTGRSFQVTLKAAF